MGSMRRNERRRVKRTGRKNDVQKGNGRKEKENVQEKMEFRADTDIKERQTDHGERISWKKEIAKPQSSEVLEGGWDTLDYP